MAVRTYQGIAPTLGERVYVDPAAVIIGRVSLGDDSSVWPMAVIRGDVHTITIGARSSVQDGAVLHVTHDGPYAPGGGPLVIGEDVTIGHQAVLHACNVGDRCLIGMGSILLDGVIVEEEVLIGAGSLVAPRTRLTTRTLWLGNPARQVRALNEREIASLKYSAGHYVRVKDSYREAP